MGCCQTTKERSHTYNNKKNNKINMTPKNLEESVALENKISNNSFNMNNNQIKAIENAIISNSVENLKERLESNDINKNSKQLKEFKIGANLSLLHFSVLKQNNSKIVEFILNFGANINEPETETGNTPLFFASINLQQEIVKSLLKFNPNINHKNKNGDNIFDFLDKGYSVKTNKKETLNNGNINLRNMQNEFENNVKNSFENVEVLDDGIEILDKDNNFENDDFNKNNINESFRSNGSYNKFGNDRDRRKSEDNYYKKKIDLSPDDQIIYSNIINMLQEYKAKMDNYQNDKLKE